ncbi:MAG: quinone-dependent dihydroorotate dehydrogenase [Cyclobacteriaceae bacterium]|nr:quinone-dependent dihydroorotate dehydrogenase [Cyclobacteriaceae bacterium]MCH8514973.1 quinone-dependent dihydroorotate dehydrogenase [Cyclobacteriaceae bacterium]
MMKWLYQQVLKRFLFLLNPELVHSLFVGIGSFFGKTKVGRGLVSQFYRYKGKPIQLKVDGITYTSPVMLAAGFDYNGKLAGVLDTVSFGGDEIGSVTARPTKGNPKPRLRRMIKSQSLIVYKGLKNDGVEVIIERLKKTKKPKNFIWGISIAKTNDDKTVTTEAGIEDYCYSFRRLNEEGMGNFYTINISCPNVHGGESFTTPALLKPLLVALDKIPCEKPVYLKMPINLVWEDFQELLVIADQHRVSGVVIGNLNKNYDEATYIDEAPKNYRGGLSGLTCQKRSTDIIRKTKAAWGNRFTIIGCGGILSVEDAMDKLDAGADILQLITGMIFEGPHLMKSICEAYAQRMEDRENNTQQALPEAQLS